MSDQEKERSHGESRKEISRRQFLTYTLMGIGGFFAATLLVPPVRMAIDPVLKAQAGGDMVPVADISELTDEPKRFTFKVSTVDGWYKTNSTLSAWIYKDGEKIVALSPVCKHLGCTVEWNGSPDHPEHFFCPCHFGLYTKDGVNVPGTPPKAPLDLYEYEVREGKLYLGKAVPRTSA